MFSQAFVCSQGGLLPELLPRGGGGSPSWGEGEGVWLEATSAVGTSY